MKEELLQELEPFHFEQIRGLLIEIELTQKYDLYDWLEWIVSEAIERCPLKPISFFDWEVGESGYKSAYLIHLWSDEHDLDEFSDFGRCYNETELSEILEFIKSLSSTLRERLTIKIGEANFKIMPS